MIAKGDVAPDFTLKGDDDNDYTLSAFRGRKVVLVFYPLDFSPVCTKQHACLRDDAQKFQAAGAQLFGISVDSGWTHKAFVREMGLDYRLLADFNPKGAVAAQYGVYVSEAGLSRRTTVVVGPDGRVAEVLDYGFPEVPDTAPLLAALDQI